MRAGWSLISLSDVCSRITDGSHYSPTTQSVGLPYVTVRDVDDLSGKIDLEACKRISESDFADLVRNGCQPIVGDVLFSKDGTVGKVALVGEMGPFVVLSSLAILSPNQRLIFPSYLKYVMRSSEFLSEAIGKKTGVAIKRIVLKNLRGIKIPLPPLDEQKRIVAVLDEAFEGLSRARANAETNLADARELFGTLADGVLQGDLAVQPKQMRLGSIVDRLTNGFVGPTRDIYREQGVPYLLARHVRNNTLVFDGRTYVDDAFNEKNRKSKLKTGDVLLVQSGHIGHSAVVPAEHEGHNCHAMIVISAKPDTLTGEYLSAVFNTAGFQAKFQEIRTGSTVPHLTCGMVKELMIPVPPLDRQSEVCAILASAKMEIDDLTDAYSKQVHGLDTLRQSLLQKAFSGELT